MQIFVDESGTFAGSAGISASGALVIPDQQMGGFQRLYGRLRKNLPQDRGEVKGRLLNETQVGQVCEILRKVGCLFEVVVIDLAHNSNDDVDAHKKGQEEKITEHLTTDHHETLVAEVKELRKQIEKTPRQLYLQSVAMAELVYNTINHANLYYCFRLPKELGEYHWTFDAKNRDKITPWEEWWSKAVVAMVESKSFQTPMIAAEGGNYKWHDKFKTELSDYKKQFVSDSEKGEFYDLRPVLREDFKFLSSNNFGLEAVDILTNGVRRSLAGNFKRDGWLPIRELMIHWGQHYIRILSLADSGTVAPKVPYMHVLRDFSKGGRSMVPPAY